MSATNNSINPGITTSAEVNKLALVVGTNNSSIAPPYRSTLKYAEKDAQDNEAHRARYFCRYLANHADALLILDNVEVPNLVTSALPVLAGGSLACSILYTSRMTQTPHGVVAHPVEQLPEEAALHLLLETTRPALLSETLSGVHNSEASAARTACSMVSYVPLALVHLRSFLTQDRQVSLCRLVEVLTTRGISGVAAITTFPVFLSSRS